MGYRTNLLKAEKQNALQQNVKAQQTIIEKLQQTDQLQALDQLKTRFFTKHYPRIPNTFDGYFRDGGSTKSPTSDVYHSSKWTKIA